MRKVWITFTTTALDTQKCGITELAYIVTEDNKIIKKDYLPTKPNYNSLIDPKSISDFELKEASFHPSEYTQLNRFLRDVKPRINEKCILCCYSSFHIEVLKAAMERQDKNFSRYFYFEYVDVLALLRVLKVEGLIPKMSLSLPLIYKNLKGKELTHKVEATKEIYEEVIKYFLSKES